MVTKPVPGVCCATTFDTTGAEFWASAGGTAPPSSNASTNGAITGGKIHRSRIGRNLTKYMVLGGVFPVETYANSNERSTKIAPRLSQPRSHQEHAARTDPLSVNPMSPIVDFNMKSPKSTRIIPLAKSSDMTGLRRGRWVKWWCSPTYHRRCQRQRIEHMEPVPILFRESQDRPRRSLRQERLQFAEVPH